MRRRATLLTASGTLVFLACVSLNGCGSLWTYDDALQKRIRDQGYAFEPPDSEAFVPPDIPEVYAVVFTEDIIEIRDSLERDSNPVEVPMAPPDTVFIFPPDTSVVPAEEPAAGRTVREEMSAEEEAALLAQVEADMNTAETLLSELRKKNDPRAASEEWEAARGLWLQAESALEQKDLRGAANLAQKARILAESLATPRP